MSKTQVIKISDLKKSFGQIKALDGISFSVERGDLFAFLGVNGAGKSTTINILCGQLTKDSGCVEVDGSELESDLEALKSKIGVVFQSSVLDKSLSVRDNLESRAALYGICGKQFEARLAELAEMLEFGDLLSRTVGKLSGGQRRRVDIARALLHSPKILVLDEPTTGLDPQTRKLLWNVIRDLRKSENMTVFLTTHYMEEAADADHVVIIDSGKISAEGSPIELKNSYTHDFVTLYGVEEDVLVALGVEYEKLKDGYRFSIENTRAATELIVKHPEIFVDYEITKGKMDDVFLALTGKTLSEQTQTKKGGARK